MRGIVSKTSETHPETMDDRQPVMRPRSTVRVETGNGAPPKEGSPQQMEPEPVEGQPVEGPWPDVRRPDRVAGARPPSEPAAKRRRPAKEPPPAKERGPRSH